MAITPSTHHDDELPISTLPPPPPLSPSAISSYNHRIRPLLDAVDQLRTLQVMKYSIQLPTIVVVGDQSSGKSSVLESLASVSLPRGEGICTRVPLIMRLENQPDPDSDPTYTLEYMGKTVNTSEKRVGEDIECATQEIAGGAKGIVNSPIMLLVKKRGMPDLTMVDLPGITQVPVHRQPENIYEIVKEMIIEYIKPEETIILNVMSATADFSTCDSTMLAQSVDKTGARTLAVVTQADQKPGGLFEKVTNDGDFRTGLGFVCVRNRVGQESFELARTKEYRLFETHPSLSRINKLTVGIPALARILVQIQANMISKSLSNLVIPINDKLNSNITKLNKLPKCLSSVTEALEVFVNLMMKVLKSLEKIMIIGEYNEYPDDLKMHCAARLAEMLDKYSVELHGKEDDDPLNNDSSEFLTEEVRAIEEANKGIGLPDFPPRDVFRTLLEKQVDGITPMPESFVTEVWAYVEQVLISVINKHCDNYPQIISSTKQAASNLIATMKYESLQHVSEMIEMEKHVDYTCNPEYSSSWSKLMSSCQLQFIKMLEKDTKPSVLTIEGFGKVDVGHLRNVKHLAQEALDMKMRMVAYWSIVLKRLIDWMGLHMGYNLQKLVNKMLVKEIIKEMKMEGLERMVEEHPSVAAKRERLNTSITLLRESKEVVSEIVDRIQIEGLLSRD